MGNTQRRVYCTKTHNTFAAHYLESLISPWFQLRDFDASGNVQPDDVLMISLPECTNQVRFKDISVPTLDRVHAIIVDNLQEVHIRDLDFLAPWRHKTLVLTAGQNHHYDALPLLIIPEWFWYFESLWYHSRDYHLYQPRSDLKNKLFFMPIRRSSMARDLIYDKLQSRLHDAVYSFVERGIRLPGIPEQHTEDQRWLNPDWYDSTLFSVVNEDYDDRDPICWTEKSCKPLAFYHPFILVAQRHLLALIKSHGFLSFPELFDESYDDLHAIQDRIQSVAQQVLNLDRDNFRAPEIQAKVQHNHDRFFDIGLVQNLIASRLILPLREFLETKH
jgi:hypothetical protein